MLDISSARPRLGAGVAFLVVLFLAATASAQSVGPLLTAGIFRQSVPGVVTKPVLWKTYDEMFAAGSGVVDTMRNNKFELTDIDIHVVASQLYYSAIFTSGVAKTTTWDLTPDAFISKTALLQNQGINLISLRAYANPQDGQIHYFGIYQSGGGPQKFLTARNFTAFKAYVDASASGGYFLTCLASYLQGGGDLYIGVLRSGYKQGPHQYDVFAGDWNSIANQIIADAAKGLRLVSLTNDGQLNYAGAWMAGTDPFEVVAATDAAVFDRKTGELGGAGLSPVRVLIESRFQPPIGLGTALHGMLDRNPTGGFTGGYTYSVYEKGALTARGGVGFARAAWDAAPDHKLTAMNSTTRLDIGSVTKWIAAVAIYKELETDKTHSLNTTVKQALGQVVDWNTAASGVADITINELLNMDSGINEGNCGSENYYSVATWLQCVVKNCTQPYAGTLPKGVPYTCQSPGPPHIVSAYSDPDFTMLRVVIENLTQMSFEEYVHRTLFVPLGINDPAYSWMDIRNANCQLDLTTPTRPLYYNAHQTSGPGDDGQEYNGEARNTPAQANARSVAVCGNGGMQMTAAQAGAFWAGLMHAKLINDGDLQALLGDWVINKSGAVTWAGQGFAKNGGYMISCLENDCGGVGSPNGLGQVSAAVVSPKGIDTQITVFTNFWGSMPSTAPADAQGPSVVGMDWMAFHPLDTVSIASRNPAAREALCLNIEGGGAAPNTPIIQYK